MPLKSKNTSPGGSYAERINYLEGLLAEQAGSDTYTRTEAPTAEELAITAQTMRKLRDAAARAAT